jgi:hypothetical protein
MLDPPTRPKEKPQITQMDADCYPCLPPLSRFLSLPLFSAAALVRVPVGASRRL